jgi:hypothetical protein
LKVTLKAGTQRKKLMCELRYLEDWNLITWELPGSIRFSTTKFFLYKKIEEISEVAVGGMV